MNNKHLKKLMPWYGDIADHPDSPLIPFYASGRCQDSEVIVCPYCGKNHDTSDFMLNDQPLDCGGTDSVECESCCKEFRVDASFGYGYSTYPKKCKNGNHHYVFSGQYWYEGEHAKAGWKKVFDCIFCEQMKMYQPDYAPLPWKDEYNDPSYFDPEGILDSGKTLKEKFADQHGEKGTPILDWLDDTKKRPWLYEGRLRETAARAMAKHEYQYANEGGVL